MATNVLVVHGPNLNLLGERPGDERGRTLDELNGLIHQRADELGLAVKIYQSNHEGELVNFLQAERRWAESIIINPEALTHTSYVLRECLSALGKPALEVHLTDIRRRESWRRRSVIKDVCAGQVMGKGFESYLIALERIASGDYSGRRKASRIGLMKKSVARRAEAKSEAKPKEPAAPPSAPRRPSAARGASAPPAPSPLRRPRSPWGGRRPRRSSPRPSSSAARSCGSGSPSGSPGRSLRAPWRAGRAGTGSASSAAAPPRRASASCSRRPCRR